MKEISIVVPAYNEADCIYKMVQETVRAMEELGCGYEIVVVDDGSSDGTPDEIARAAADFSHVKSVRLPENSGKGNAMRRGFQASGKELVCFLDADLDIHPYQVQNLLAEMERSGADVVIGSKRHPRSQLEYPAIRKVYSTVYYYLIFLLFRLPIRDTQTGIKLFRREVLAKVFPLMVSMSFVIDLELLLITNYMGYSIAEAPVKITFQRDMGRITWVHIRGIMVDTMSIFYRFYVLGYYGSPLKPVVDYEPRISIVIPTRDIDPMVTESIGKCNELNYSNFDIKLVPDSDLDVELLQPGSRIIPSGPVGPAIKRNMAVRDSNAEIIAFTDGDAFPDYDWLRNAVPYFEDEETCAVGGPAITPFKDNRRQQAGGAVYSATMISGWRRYRYRPHAFRKVDDYPTVNLLVRKSDFEAVGGFNEEFWPGEDTELCMKLTKDLGKQILYVPNVVVYHHRRPVYLPHLKQIFGYGVLRGFFVKKYPETSRRFIYFLPTLFVLGVIAGFVASFFNEIVMWSYVSAMSLYLALAFISSIKTLGIRTNLLTFPGIVATHFTYGIGLIKGLLSREMKYR